MSNCKEILHFEFLDANSLSLLTIFEILQSRLLLRLTLLLTLRPLLRLLLTEDFLTGLFDTPLEDLLSERDLDLENDRRPRERLRERRRSLDLKENKYLQKFWDELKYVFTVFDHDVHLHYVLFAGLLDGHIVPFEHVTPFRQAFGRP